MSLLAPLSATSSAAKIGLYSKQGGGKSVTSTLLAVGLSATYHTRAPIAYFDTENASQFVRPICEAEGIDLLGVQSRSFVDMRDTLQEAETRGCCALIVDSYSHPWAELNEALKARLGFEQRRLQFQHREELWKVWGEWTRAMRASPLHVLLAGRLAWDYADDEDEAGDPRVVKLGTKMRGESDAGYEPDLLIELEAIQDAKRDTKTRSRRGSIVHHLRILKDRTMVLNGLSFPLKDLNGYVKGDFKKTFGVLQPHFERLGIGREGLLYPQGLARSSAALFTPATGESKFAEAARRRTIALEKIDSALAMIWPGQTGDEKRLRHIVLQSVFKTRSRTEIEGKDPLTLESAVQLVEAFESILPSDKARDEAEVIATIESVRNDLREKSEAF